MRFSRAICPGLCERPIGQTLVGSEGLVVATYEEIRIATFKKDGQGKGLEMRLAGGPWADDTLVAAGALRGSSGSCDGLMGPYDLEHVRYSRRSEKKELLKGGCSEDWGSEDDMLSLTSGERMSLADVERKNVLQAWVPFAPFHSW